VEVFVEENKNGMSLISAFLNPPVLYSTFTVIFIAGWGFGGNVFGLFSLVCLIFTIIAAVIHLELGEDSWGQWYNRLLANPLPFSILVFLAVFAGGVIEILPTVILNKAANLEGVRQIPYTPLELAGRDIYVREGCYLCHSQQIRTLVGDVLRYGPPSKMGESIYDHPYQWGSKRIGPDLAREGGKYPNLWHYMHMQNPRQTSVGSIMPNFPWLYTQKTDLDALPSDLRVMRILGVPYLEQPDGAIKKSALAQAQTIADDLSKSGATAEPDKEIIALISYLQKLGKSEVVLKTAQVGAVK